MKIQIAISPNFGGFPVPLGFESLEVGTAWRVELAQYLIDNATVSEVLGNYDETKGGIQLIKKMDGQLVESSYYFMVNNSVSLVGHLARLSVIEVDTEKGWVLSNYDGAESVEDVPQYRQTDSYGRHEKVMVDVEEYFSSIGKPLESGIALATEQHNELQKRFGPRDLSPEELRDLLNRSASSSPSRGIPNLKGVRF